MTDSAKQTRALGALPLLSYAAGAEEADEEHPIARAILRHAAQRGITPQPVRRSARMVGRGLSALPSKNHDRGV